jgi:nucleotide-binding universal stress UspA family protein
MKNILVPIDFSVASQNATKYAASLASIFHAKLILLNVIPPAFIIDDESAPSLMMAQAELLEINKNLVSKEIEVLSKKNFVNIEGYVGEGSPVDVAQEMAVEKNADIIVMGMKGKGKSNSVFGSTTTAMIRKSSFPVLVIPENACYQSIDTITFASDFETSAGMKHYASLHKLADKYDSSIMILNVQKNESSMNAEKVTGKMETEAIFSKFNHSFHSVENENVVDGINSFMEENPTDVLAMVAHKHSVFERLFGTVHTKLMSQQSKVPLLVLQNK